MKSKVSPLIEQFVRELEFRNYSQRTIHSYSGLLMKAEAYCQVQVDKISVEQFKDYLHSRITTEGISVSMVNQYISAYKIFLIDILKQDWPGLRIKRPRRVKKLPVILSIEEVEKLISVTRNIKHKAILMLAYSAGLRRQEILDMKPSAIDSSRMQVHVVQGKGKKDRYTILSSKALEILRLYFRYDRPTQFLFETQGRKGEKLSASTSNQIVKNGALKADIKKKVSFHTLRLKWFFFNLSG